MVKPLSNTGKVFSDFFRFAGHDLVILDPSIPFSQLDLREKSGILLEQLQKLGYSPATIKSDEWMLQKIIFLQSNNINKIQIYKKLLSKYKAKTENVLVRRWMLFDLYDIIPMEKGSRTRSPRYATEQLNESHRQFVNLYILRMADKLRDTTVHEEESTLAAFLVFLQGRDKNVTDFTESDVLDYKLCTNVNNATLRRIGRILNIMDVQSSKFFPGAIGVTSTIYPAISRQEMTTLIDSLFGKDKRLTTLERAVGLLLVTTGIRSSDLRDLSFNNIDWQSGQVFFFQNKTGNPVAVSLLPAVGNAILDYLKDRPSTTLQNVFVKHNHSSNKCHAIVPYKVMNDIYTKLNIRVNQRRGTHLLRHAFATTMLNNDVDLAVISSILGHTSPASSLNYLSSDLASLQKCALPISLTNADIYGIR